MKLNGEVAINKYLTGGEWKLKIIVYDKNYTNPDLEITEHSSAVHL